MAKTRIVADPGVPQVIVTREFAAPRELLFRAYTDPALLVQWMGPRSVTITVDSYEIRDGGRWRYLNHDADGTEYGFHGLFHGTPSVDAGIVQTFEYEGWPGKVSLQTLTFEEQDGHTLVRMNSVFQTVADRDAMIASGMEVGINEGMERLEDLLAILHSATDRVNPMS